MHNTDLQLKIATVADQTFAHDLTRQNMEAYVIKYWDHWDPASFLTNYLKRENFIIWKLNERAGYIGVERQVATLYLHDLQIADRFQRQGIGSWALKELERLAGDRQCQAVALGCIWENPALALYKRHGFRITEEYKETALMVKQLALTLPAN